MEQSSTQPAERRAQTICLLILTAIAVGFTLSVLKGVLVPFVLALFFSMTVTPVMDFLQRRFRLHRGASIFATGLLGLGVLLGFGGVVAAGLAEISSKSDDYVFQIKTMTEEFNGSVTEFVKDSSFIPKSVQADILEKNRTETLTSFIPAMARETMSWTVNSGLTLVSRGFLVMIFMMFLIAGYRPAAANAPPTLKVEVRNKVKEYMRVKLMVSALTGILTFSILRIIGVDLALVFGLAAFFLNFIPSVGSIIAMVLPLPVVLLADDLSLASKLMALGLPGLVQFSVGNILEPKLLGDSLDLNPIVVLLSLIFWGFLWGPVGMLLSVPITAVIKFLLERSPLTRPVAAILSDQPSG